MADHVLVDRLQFTLTITFHYLFPILTMGLAIFIAWMKSVSYLGRPDHRLRPLRKTDADRDRYETAARFWAKIFAVNFAFGVVTGIPMEFQFGTNWAVFSNYAGGVIGTTLAMEGIFAFFAESVFLGVFLAGAGRVSPRVHWLSAIMVFVGSWLSGLFIIATNAWMQHPVGYKRSGENVEMTSFWEFMTNPWLPWQYLHNMGGAAISGAFVLAATGAFYLLSNRHLEFARLCLRMGVVGGVVFCALQIFPTGDRSAHDVAVHQPATFAAMEGMFETQEGAPLVIIGNPNTEERKLESTLEMPKLLSFLTSQRWNERIKGLNDIPEEEWPDSVPLVYYSYHIMVGIGTILLLVSGVAAFLLWRGRLYRSRGALWALMLSFPFTYIANIAGWTTAETGRQPWTVYGLLRTEDAASPASSVPSGTGLFTLLGFSGLYLFLGILYLMLMARLINAGPEDPELPTTSTAAAAGTSQA